MKKALELEALADLLEASPDAPWQTRPFNRQAKTPLTQAPKPLQLDRKADLETVMNSLNRLHKLIPTFRQYKYEADMLRGALNYLKDLQQVLQRDLNGEQQKPGGPRPKLPPGPQHGAVSAGPARYNAQHATEIRAIIEQLQLIAIPPGNAKALDCLQKSLGRLIRLLTLVAQGMS